MTGTVEHFGALVPAKLGPGLVVTPVDAILVVDERVEMEVSSDSAIIFTVPVRDGIGHVIIVHAVEHTTTAVVVDWHVNVDEVFDHEAGLRPVAGHAAFANRCHVGVAGGKIGSKDRGVVLEALGG